MNRQFTSRVLAAALLAILCGMFTHRDYVKWSQRGRQEFIDYQSRRFDRYMNPPRPVPVTIIGWLAAAAVTLGFYESMALLFSTLLQKTQLWPEDKTPSSTSSA